MYVYRKVVKSLGKYEKIFAYYTRDNKKIGDVKSLEYIKTLKIPPNYKDVEIDMNPRAKILAIGYDKEMKKQYIYNPTFIEKQTDKKNCNLIQFGTIKNKIEGDIFKLLSQSEMTKNKIIAIILSIIINCNFRIGNKIGKDKYNSFGVSTLLKKHMVREGDKLKLDFIGKRGVRNVCEIKDKLIIKNLIILHKKARESLFVYDDIQVTSQDVNQYLKQYDGDVTTKNFRTWYANIYFLKAIIKLGAPPKEELQRRKNIVEAIKYVAEKLHHTPAICKKKYIINDLFDMYREHPNKFGKIFFVKNTDKSLINFLEKSCHKKNV